MAPPIPSQWATIRRASRSAHDRAALSNCADDCSSAADSSVRRRAQRFPSPLAANSVSHAASWLRTASRAAAAASILAEPASLTRAGRAATPPSATRRTARRAAPAVNVSACLARRTAKCARSAVSIFGTAVHRTPKAPSAAAMRRMLMPFGRSECCRELAINCPRSQKAWGAGLSQRVQSRHKGKASKGTHRSCRPLAPTIGMGVARPGHRLVQHATMPRLAAPAPAARTSSQSAAARQWQTMTSTWRASRRICT